MSARPQQPLISIVMPVYNGGRYLTDAIASIIEQTHSDWELICVNDGSTDQSAQVLEWFARQDDRIRIVHQDNTGIVGALNHGCSLARAPLIARMDQDDIALPERLALQLDYLQQRPECMVLGGAILEIDSDGSPLSINGLPTSHSILVERLLTRRTGHFHPTVIFRAEGFEAVGGYRNQYQWVEDHDLWLRMAQRGQLANLPQVVLCYRQHASSICWQRSAQQRQLMNQLLTDAYRQRGLELPDELVMDNHRERSAAGPGKWARAAAKGGFPTSFFKHLRQLWSSPEPRSYQLRMTLECLPKLLLGCLRRTLTSQHVAVPNFTRWHTRYLHDHPDATPRRNVA
jgi:glycosyltransferase involved in cell wall biosynthesis